MASMGAFDGKVFYVGGDDDFFPGSGVFDEVFIYDIASNSWSQGTSMPTATSGAGTAQAGEFLYVVGGWGAAAPGTQCQCHPALRHEHRHVGDRTRVRSGHGRLRPGGVG